MVLFYGISLFIYFIYIFNDQDKATLDDAGKNANVIKILKAQMFFGFAIFLLLIFTEIGQGTVVALFSAVYGLVIFGLLDQIKKRQK